MIVSLTVVRYKPFLIPLALFAMAVHRIPLAFDKQCTFWKLMGCGRNGTFDLNPDWRQWALLAVWESREAFEASTFIQSWWKRFTNEKWTILMEPISSHGKWDSEDPFTIEQDNNTSNGPIGVLTRATIRFSKLKSFWANVEPVAKLMENSPGYITSVGVGEAPVFRQATFSIWKDLESMKAFAYGSKEHSEVIRKTRQQNWYSEELFARFRIILSEGSLNGLDPLNGLVNNK